MASHEDDIVPLSAADKRLQASLNRVKFACSDCLDNPTKETKARFSAASEEHVSALEGAGLKKQAGHMRKVDKDFRNAKTTSKRQRIVECLAKSLVSKTSPSFLWHRAVTVHLDSRSVRRDALVGWP